MRWISWAWAAWAAGCLAGPQLPAQAPPAPPAPQALFAVVLDAAHGGSDTGARLAGGQLEKNVTLALSVRLRSLLAARGFSVVTTRETDTFLSPDQRAGIANQARAQACLILHATASGSGVHLFVSALAPSAPLPIPAWKTAQSGWVTRSLALAGTLNSALLAAGINVTLGRIDLPGLDSMTCPAVAVEAGPEPASGENPAAGADSSDYQAQVATALAAALLEWRASAWRGGARP
ncbi:MAG: N-acetylmuramoyl-L-alanine amidase family protein [Terracidiphilus sp.]